MTTLAPAEFQEFFDSQEETVSRHGHSAYRRTRCRWVDRYLAYTFLGTPYFDNYWMRCVEVGIKRLGISGDPDQDEAEVELRYATLTGPEDAPSSALDFGIEILEVGGGRTWTTGGAAVDIPLSLVIPFMEEIIEVSTLEVPVGALWACLGKINAYTWRGWPANCVMFQPPASRTEWDPDLIRYRSRLAFYFKIGPRSWNEAWNPVKTGGAGWDTTSPLLFETADFSMLGF